MHLVKLAVTTREQGGRAVVTLDGGMATEAQIDDSLREAAASTPWVVDCGPLAFSPLVS